MFSRADEKCFFPSYTQDAFFSRFDVLIVVSYAIISSFLCMQAATKLHTRDSTLHSLSNVPETPNLGAFCHGTHTSVLPRNTEL